MQCDAAVWDSVGDQIPRQQPDNRWVCRVWRQYTERSDREIKRERERNGNGRASPRKVIAESLHRDR